MHELFRWLQVFRAWKSKLIKIFSVICWSPGLLMMFSIVEYGWDFLKSRVLKKSLLLYLMYFINTWHRKIEYKIPTSRMTFSNGELCYVVSFLLAKMFCWPVQYLTTFINKILCSTLKLYRNQSEWKKIKRKHLTNISNSKWIKYAAYTKYIKGKYLHNTLLFQ